MAIHNEEVQEMHEGISKGIEASAMGMAMDTLQRSMYQFPVKSTVREIISNGIDAVADKNMALDILVHKAPVSKYFVEREGVIYKDSRFTPDYYDPNWLSNDDTVYIDYHEGTNQEKAYVTIEDNGTGLGGKRLEGYFQLYYSTKRLSSASLGKFGIGAKAPLSTGVPFYTMETRYNGKLFRFNIFSMTVDSIVPAFDLDKGVAYGYEMLSGKDGKQIKAHWIPTEEKNGVKITIQVKKTHKAQYIDAVKSQLLYFDNLRFRVHHETGTIETIAYKADILYEDEYIVLSNNSWWAKPHILLNKVNYGYIDWDELELEAKTGNIGIKVAPEDIEVNPSRESIMWSDKTKQMVLDRYKSVVGIATDFIQKELKETDFIKWMRICYQIHSRRWGSNSIVNRLASIIDLSQVEPHFPGNTDIRFHPSNLMDGLFIRHYSFETGRKANRTTQKVIREEIKYGFAEYSDLPIVLIDENTSVRRDKYLLTKVYPEGFLGIRAPEWIGEDFKDVVVTEDLMKQLELFSDGSKENKKRVKGVLSSVGAVWEGLKASSEAVRYSSIEVPTGFTCTEEDEEETAETEEEQEEAQKASITAAERRKVEGKVIVHTPYYAIRSETPVKGEKLYSMSSIEVPIKELNDWDQEEIYYGNEADLELLHFATLLTREVNKNICYPREASFGPDYNANARCTHYYDNQRLRIIKVAKSNNRLFADFKHIQKFFVDVKNNHITMSNVLIRWNTARQIAARLNEVAFLWNFKAFDADRCDRYRKLRLYVKENYADVEALAEYGPFGASTEAYNDLISHLDNVQAFQLFVKAGNSPEDIAELAGELFANNTLKGGEALDTAVWEEFNDLLEYGQTIAPLLNQLPVLTGLIDVSDLSDRFDPHYQFSDWEVCSEVEQEIRQYMQMKGVL